MLSAFPAAASHGLLLRQPLTQCVRGPSRRLVHELVVATSTKRQHLLHHRYQSYPAQHQQRRYYPANSNRSREPQIGTTTPVPDESAPTTSRSLFYFEAGYAGWAKRPNRPFPPPFLSPPSGSFSDPLSTTNRAQDRRRARVNGEMIRGVTIGDDAVIVSDNFVGSNDGVGAWATRDRGNAPLWSRLVLHFWAVAAEQDAYGGHGKPKPVEYLTAAYEQTKEALSKPNEWLGTTTVSGALLATEGDSPPHPMLYVTQLGDSKVLVIRPRDKSVIYATEEQWHYFDCPRQLGTNSPDTPADNAVMDAVTIEEEDVVLAMSDGVTDNLWEHEIAENVVTSMQEWQEGNGSAQGMDKDDGASYAEGMRFVAQQLVKAARHIAEDPFAESPFMERAVEEGLAIEGGKLDDISVVAALCKRRNG